MSMFDHHPDPAIDFEIEVETIQGAIFDFRHGLPTIGDAADILRRINTALSFRFIPGGECQRAMDTLRAAVDPFEAELLAAVA